MTQTNDGNMSKAPNPPLSSDARFAQRLQWARKVCGDPSLQLERASADASSRSYWRTIWQEPSALIMDSPPALEPLQPWLMMRDHLDRAGVRVPAVRHVDCEQGFALLEDLGPTTLLTVLSLETADVWFEAAIHQLIRLQSAPIPPGIDRFDERQLARDASLFNDWFLERHLRLQLNRAEISALRDVQSLLTECVHQQATVLVHRDFMPRNLIPLKDNSVAVIDFQDCMEGPIAYDPMSLFKDTGISWPLAAIARWLGSYYQSAQQRGLIRASLKQFLQAADWMGIQRHLKVLGIFARLHHRDGKSLYLQEIPRMIAYLRDILPKYPEFAALQALIHSRVMPALARDHSQ